MATKDNFTATNEAAHTTASDAGPVRGETNIIPDGAVDGSSAPDEQLTRRQKLRLVGLVILKRLRFIAILAGVGMFIGYWDTVQNYWDKWTHPKSVAVRELESGHEFYCPMDPQVIRSTYEPNGNVPKCPICGMPLSVRVKGVTVKLPEGITGRVQLSPERVQLAGIKTSTIQYRSVARQTKTVGYVAFDESRLSRVVSRVDGYVEKLYVDETFTEVHQEDPLAEIYSPDLYSAAQELVLASRAGGVADLAAAARKKLLLFGVSQQDIDGIVASGQPTSRLVIRSPQTGYVVEKKIVVGSSVEAKMTLLEVADLSTVWIEADVYEQDIPFLQIGQKIEVTVDADPHLSFSGKLALIYPRMEATTRTNRIRLKLDNAEGKLRPGMFATVRINTPLESIEPYKSMAAKTGRVVLTGSSNETTSLQYEFLCVPERAVIDTGSKKVVYVEREPGIFEGVEVELGPRDDGYYPVLKGLNANDKIAAAGGFLIDAETRLNPAAASTYFGASGGPQSSDRSNPPSVPNQHQGNQTPANQDKLDANQPKPELKPKVAVVSPTAEDLANIEQLPEANRQPARAQGVCPVTGAALGSMGVPVKIILRGQTVFLCCKGCVSKAKRNPNEILKKLSEAAKASEKSTEPTNSPVFQRQENP